MQINITGPKAIDLTILRYKGGSGGEALYRFLTGGNGRANPANAMRNQSPIGGLLQSEWTGERPHNRRWQDLDAETVHGLVMKRLGQAPDGSVIHSHYVMHGSVLRNAFPRAFIIDLMPRKGHVWMCHLFQRYKEMSARMDEMPAWLVGVPGAEAIERCLARHGWFPAFWPRQISDGVDVWDLDHFFGDIAMDRKNADEGVEWLEGSDMIIDARAWLLDITSVAHLDCASSLHHQDWITPWKEANRRILSDLGVDHAFIDGMPVEPSLQQRIVRDALEDRLRELNLLVL